MYYTYNIIFCILFIIIYYMFYVIYYLLFYNNINLFYRVNIYLLLLSLDNIPNAL